MQQKENKVPYETVPPGVKRKRNNNARKRLTLASSYEEEADDIMKWAGWYWRLGHFEQAAKQRKMADDRYAHAKKLRNES